MPRIFQRPYTNSLFFNGSNAGLLKNTPAGINTGTGNVTITGWMYLTSDALGTLLTLETATNNARAFLIGQLSGIYYVFSDGVTVNITITRFSFLTYIGTFRWRRFVFSTSGSAISLWVDGVNIINNQSMTINTGALTRLVLGKRIVSGSDIQLFTGYLKDVQIYNNYFTNADVNADFYDAVKPYTPVSSFLMEEGTGTSVGDSVGSNTLTASNTSWSTLFLPTSARKLITFTDRMAYRTMQSSLDVSTNAGILVNNAASLNPTDYVALEIWCKPIPNQNIVLFDNSNSGVTNSYFLIVDGNGGIGWYSTIGGITRNILFTGPKLLQNQWNFVSAHYNGSIIEIFANGVLVSSLSCTGTLGTNPGQLRIGQYYNTGIPVLGFITQPRIYHTNAYNLAFHKSRFYDNLEDPTINATLVLNMPCNEGGLSAVADVSGQANNGTFSRAIWNPLVPMVSNRVSRSYAQSLKFNGSASDYVDLGSAGAIAASTAAFTTSLWFKREKEAPNPGAPSQIESMIGDMNNGAQNHWYIATQGPNRKLLTTVITSVGPKALVGNGIMPIGIWMQVFLVYDGAFIKWYVNGYLDASTNHTGTVLASTSGMQIASGAAPIGGVLRYFGGWIADVKYWDRALSAQEIFEIHMNGRDDSVIRTGLKGEWLLQGNVLDTSGQGNHGTLFGSAFDTANVPMKDRVLVS